MEFLKCGTKDNSKKKTRKSYSKNGNFYLLQSDEPIIKSMFIPSSSDIGIAALMSDPSSIFSSVDSTTEK